MRVSRKIISRQGKRMEYNGWEKIEELGKGGQSEVFLARTPKRAAERRECMRLIKRGGYDEDQVPRYFEYARPERPEEQGARSEEHTSELQSPCNLVCRLLLEKKQCHHDNHIALQLGT